MYVKYVKRIFSSRARACEMGHVVCRFWTGSCLVILQSVYPCRQVQAVSSRRKHTYISQTSLSSTRPGKDIVRRQHYMEMSVSKGRGHLSPCPSTFPHIHGWALSDRHDIHVMWQDMCAKFVAVSTVFLGRQFWWLLVQNEAVLYNTGVLYNLHSSGMAKYYRIEKVATCSRAGSHPCSLLKKPSIKS